MNRTRCAIAASSLVLLAGSSSASIATYFDGIFQPSDWNELVITNADGIPSTTAVSQSLVGGNSNEFRRINLSLTATAPGGSVWSLSINNNAFYNPSTQGAITFIDYSEDSINFLANSGNGQGTGLLVLQGGSIFVQRNPLLVMPQPAFTNWAPNAAPGLVAADLWELNPNGLLNQFSNPDFSASGGVMQLGFWRGASSGNFVGTAFREAGIDNWSVRIVPAPASVALLGIAGLTASRRKR